MKTGEVAEKLELERLTPIFERDVTGVYMSDMVSDVIANAKPGDLLVTAHVSCNALAAADLVDVSAIIVTQGKRPGEDVLRLAARAELSIFATAMNRMQVAARLYESGIR